MGYDLEKIATAINDLHEETNKPKMLIVSALADSGVLSQQQDMELEEIFKE